MALVCLEIIGFELFPFGAYETLYSKAAVIPFEPLTTISSFGHGLILSGLIRLGLMFSFEIRTLAHLHALSKHLAQRWPLMTDSSEPSYAIASSWLSSTRRFAMKTSRRPTACVS